MPIALYAMVDVHSIISHRCLPTVPERYRVCVFVIVCYRILLTLPLAIPVAWYRSADIYASACFSAMAYVSHIPELDIYQSLRLFVQTQSSSSRVSSLLLWQSLQWCPLLMIVVRCPVGVRDECMPVAYVSVATLFHLQCIYFRDLLFSFVLATITRTSNDNPVIEVSIFKRLNQASLMIPPAILIEYDLVLIDQKHEVGSL